MDERPGADGQEVGEWRRVAGEADRVGFTLLTHWRDAGEQCSGPELPRLQECPQQSAPPPAQPSSAPYLLGPKLQRLLPGFLKVFLLADVGLGSKGGEAQ